MKLTTFSIVAFAAETVLGHATFQAFFHADQKYKASCARLPQSNNPVTNVLSNDIRCNINSGPVGGKCTVAAGGTVTVEMHQQPNDRTCTQEAIGGAHYGPVMAYMTKVSDAKTADGSTGWFKIFQDGWSKKSGSAQGDDDNWGVKDLNKCCGRMNIKIPSNIPSGDYLLRSEVIALHTAAALGAAQFYMTCFQITVTGGGTTSPATVKFPGAYAATDPGIKVDIHSSLSSYVVPGPAVFSGGSTRVPGSGTCTGVESGTAPGPPLSTTKTSAGPVVTGGLPGCSVAKYQQCGGTGYTGCVTCAAGSTCQAISPPYYYQCA